MITHYALTVEQIAYGMACIDGKEKLFLTEREQPYNKDDTGTYEGYMSEAERVVEVGKGFK